MDYVILIGVVAILAICGFVGYKQGMVKILLSMVAMLVTYILAASLTIPVSAALKATTPAYDTIEKSVSSMVEESKVDSTSIEALNLPTQIEALQLLLSPLPFHRPDRSHQSILNSTESFSP